MIINAYRFGGPKLALEFYPYLGIEESLLCKVILAEKYINRAWFKSDISREKLFETKVTTLSEPAIVRLESPEKTVKIIETKVYIFSRAVPELRPILIDLTPPHKDEPGECRLEVILFGPGADKNYWDSPLNIPPYYSLWFLADDPAIVPSDLILDVLIKGILKFNET